MSTYEGRLEEISLLIGGAEKKVQEDVYKCYMCTRDYSDTDVVAKLFHCGHHICKDCVLRKLSSNRVFICDFCRYSITVSRFCKQVPTEDFKFRSSNLSPSHLSSPFLYKNSSFILPSLLGFRDSINRTTLPLENAVESLPDYIPMTADAASLGLATKNQKPRFKLRTYLSKITGISGTYGFGICYILGLSEAKPFYYKYFV